MFTPFNQEELALLERLDFLGHVSEPDLAAALNTITTGARGHQSTSNELGARNRQLIEALERFAATCESSSDARVAQALNLKLRAALAAAERP